MRTILAILVLLAAVAVCVLAQNPQPCTSASQFEAHVVEVDHARGFAVRGHFVYDQLGLRTSFLEEIEESGHRREYYHRIHLYKTKMSYRINLRNKTCTVIPIDYSFRVIGVPQNATFRYSAYVGSDAIWGSGVLVNLWEEHFPHGQWSGSFTDFDCLIYEDNFFNHSTIGYLQTTFFDIEIGINDPDVFHIPSECTSARKSKKRAH